MNRQKKYTTEVWQKKDIRWLAAGMLALGVFIGVCIASVVVLISSQDYEVEEYPAEHRVAVTAEARPWN